MVLLYSKIAWRKYGKKERKNRQSISITLEPHVLEALGIDENSELDLFVKDGSLIIKPRHQNDELMRRKQENFKKTVTQLVDKYAPVLEKLSKS
jgi:antitoxin component of MazEF toxin-antitoxin module